MARLVLSLSIFFALVFNAFAQDSAQDSTVEAPKNVLLTVSYFGDYVMYPGMSFNIQYPFRMVVKEKIKRNGTLKSKDKVFLVGLQNVFYSHPKFWSGYTLSPSVAYKTIRSKGFVQQPSLGLGLQRVFLHERTYTVDDDGNVSAHKGGGWYFIPSFSYGVGWDFSKSKSKPIPFTVMLSPSIAFQYPMNNTLFTHIGIELGGTINLHKLSKPIYAKKKTTIK